jgi:hypothetical protein
VADRERHETHWRGKQLSRSRRETGELVGISFHKVAVGGTALSETMARDIQQIPVDIDRNDVSRDLCNLQRKPTVA